MRALKFLVVLSAIGVAFCQPTNPTTGEVDCCNAAKMQQMNSIQIAQEKMIADLKIQVKSLWSELSTLNSNKECPAGWARHANKCYYFDPTPRVWSSARDACFQKDAKLVSVETFEEDLFITTSINSMPASQTVAGYFTSGKETDPKSWTWTSTGKLMLPYAPWNPTQGPHTDHDQDCHVYWRDDRFRWHDFQCHHGGVGSICEKDF